MNSFLRCAVAALSVAAIAATVPAVAADNMSSSMMAASSMTVKLTAQNGSGESGTAVLKDVTGGEVLIDTPGDAVETAPGDEAVHQPITQGIDFGLFESVAKPVVYVVRQPRIVE